MLDAAIWRDQHHQRLQVALAWRTALFTRAKRLPPLKQLLTSGPAKPLRGKELEKRRREFADMKRTFDLSKLNKPKEE